MKNTLTLICLIAITQQIFAQWVPAVPYFPNNTMFVTSAIEYNDNIVIGGPFASESDCPFDRIAMWNGTEWTDIGGGIQTTGPNLDKSVYVLAEFGGELYAGGCFNNWDNNISNIAKYNGTEWQRLNDSLYSFCVYACKREPNALYFGGTFTHILSLTETETARVLKIDSAGLHYIPFPAMYTSNIDNLTGKIHCLAEYNGELYIGGEFKSQDNPNINNIARWDGSEWHEVGTGTDGRILDMEVYNGELYISGGFGHAGDIATISNNQGLIVPFGLAKWNNTAWLPVVDSLKWQNSFANAIKVGIYKDKLFISGSFEEINGQPAQRVAYLDSTTWVTNNIGVTSGSFFGGFTTINDSLYGIGSVSANGIYLGYLAKYEPIIDTSTAIYLTNITTPYPIEILPNPSTQQLYLKIPHNPNELLHIEIYDLLGHKLLSKRQNAEQSIDISQLPNGQYILKLYDKQGQQYYAQSTFIKQ